MTATRANRRISNRPVTRVKERPGFQSQISNSVNPPAAVRDEDRQFFHHELGLADGADHMGAGRCEPFLRHALTGVAAPTLATSAPREGMATDLFQIVFMQPRLTSAINIVAVIEHEAGAIRVTEILKTGNLYLISWLPVVEIIDDFLARDEPNETDIEFIAHGADEADQVLVFLFGAIFITLPVDEPRDLGTGAELAAQLFGAQTRGPHKIRPPMVVRESLVFFPLIHRRPTDQDYVFPLDRRGSPQAERDHRQPPNE